MTDEIKLLPSIPFACPTSLHDKQTEELCAIPAPATSTAPTVFECRNCGHAQFVIIQGDVKCISCDKLTGMSVVASNVVQELRTERQRHIESMIKMIEVILPFAEDFANRMPLARPQMRKLIAFCKERLLELKL